MIEDTSNLFQRYKANYRNSEQAASRVIEDLREDFFEDIANKMYVVMTLLYKDKSLKDFLGKYITKEDVDYLMERKQLNEIVKSLVHA